MPNSMRNDNPLEQAMRVGSPQHKAFEKLMNLSHGEDNFYDRSEDSEELQLTNYDDHPDWS